MRFVKGIGLFFIYPLTMLVIGFYAGAVTYRFLDSNQRIYSERKLPEADVPVEPEKSGDAGTDVPADNGTMIDSLVQASQKAEEDALYVASSSETLYVGTEYVLEETNIVDQSVVETTWRLPDKYVGMNREQFLSAMETYQAAPPLTELERGFVGLEVLSFSRERVVVRMDYRYVQPSNSFYLAAFDNEVLVYLEDKETVYIETQIRMDTLPDDVQQEIIQMMWVENEQELYNFLETYSS